MPDSSVGRLGARDVEDLRATLAHMEAAIVLLMRSARPAWADEIARVRNLIEKELRDA